MSKDILVLNEDGTAGKLWVNKKAAEKLLNDGIAGWAGKKKLRFLTRREKAELRNKSLTGLPGNSKLQIDKEIRE